MIVITPNDKLFDFNKVSMLYQKYKNNLGNKNFQYILKHSHFFSFFSGKKLIGCIYFNSDGEKIYINAFSERKTHKVNMECLKTALSFYNCEIYAECKYRPAIYCLLKAGFKKIKKNLYKYERLSNG